MGIDSLSPCSSFRLGAQWDPRGARGSDADVVKPNEARELKEFHEDIDLDRCLTQALKRDRFELSNTSDARKSNAAAAARRIAGFLMALAGTTAAVAKFAATAAEKALEHPTATGLLSLAAGSAYQRMVGGSHPVVRLGKEMLGGAASMVVPDIFKRPSDVVKVVGGMGAGVALTNAPPGLWQKIKQGVFLIPVTLVALAAQRGSSAVGGRGS